MSAGRPSPRRHHGVVTAVAALTGRMVRVTIASPTLRGVRHRPAQDMAVLVPTGGGRTAKRRYTIRRARSDVGEVDLDVFLHEPSGPGSRWASGVEPGSEVELIGPRGKLEISHDAGWNLLIGDEASIPAIGALCEAMAGTRTVALIEVGGEDDELPIAATEVHWVHRGNAPAGTPLLLRRAIATMQTPDGDRHAYLLGERGTMATIRDLLSARETGTGQMFVKGYWSAQRMPPIHDVGGDLERHAADRGGDDVVTDGARASMEAVRWHPAMS